MILGPVFLTGEVSHGKILACQGKFHSSGKFKGDKMQHLQHYILNSEADNLVPTSDCQILFFIDTDLLCDISPLNHNLTQNPVHFATSIFTARAYARAVLAVVILSVRPSVTRVDCDKTK